MNAINGYTEWINYRNLTAGAFSPQNGGTENTAPERPDDARRNTGAGDRPAAEPQAGLAAQTVARHAATGAVRDVRGMLESIRRAGTSLSEGDLQDMLDDMVLRGDITDDQADEIFDGLKRSREAMPTSVLRRLNVLAKSGTMTPEQRDAAAAALTGSGERLQDLVSDGTLSQDQMDAVMELCRSAVKLRQARLAYNQMQTNPLARAADSGQYGILNAYEESLAEGAMA